MEDNLFMSVKDFSVSQKTFDLIYNAEKDLLYTYPQPSVSDLPSYYESADYISHTDSNRSLFEKVYKMVRKIALQNKLNLIQKHQIANGNLLDIGAGTGEFLKLASSKGWMVAGAEPNAKARNLMEIKGVSAQIDTSQLPDNSFDVITMWHVLEHVPDYNIQFLELKRLLKANGTIFIAVPNFKSYDAKIYKEFWAAYDVPRHLWHFSKDAMKRIAVDHKFELKEVVPMRFDSFYVSMLSEKHKCGKIRVLPALLNGIRSNNYGRRFGEFSSHIYVIQNKKN